MKTQVTNAVAQTKNLKSLAELYGVCTKTMAKRIKAIGAELGDRKGKRLFMVNEVEIIFRHFGTPKIVTHIKEAQDSEANFLKRAA